MTANATENAIEIGAGPEIKTCLGDEANSLLLVGKPLTTITIMALAGWSQYCPVTLRSPKMLPNPRRHGKTPLLNDRHPSAATRFQTTVSQEKLQSSTKTTNAF